MPRRHPEGKLRVGPFFSEQIGNEFPEAADRRQRGDGDLGVEHPLLAVPNPLVVAGRTDIPERHGIVKTGGKILLQPFQLLPHVDGGDEQPGPVQRQHVLAPRPVDVFAGHLRRRNCRAPGWDGSGAA